MLILAIALFTVGLVLISFIVRKSMIIIPEDHNAIIANRQGFIKYVVPSGTHYLMPYLEQVLATFETKSMPIKATSIDVPTADGIMLTIRWHSIFSRNTNLITEKVSQRLRALPNAEKGLQRKTDIALRRLVGDYALNDLFKPAVRDRIERQLTVTLAETFQPAGIVFTGFDLQAIIPPAEVTQALNQAQAIQTLDTVIRASDSTTRDMVSAAHQLDELIEWSNLFPPYGRYAISQSTVSS